MQLINKNITLKIDRFSILKSRPPFNQTLNFSFSKIFANNKSCGALELSGLPAFFDQSRYTTQRGTTHNGQWQ